MDIKTRILKGIKFLRTFDKKSDKDLYRRAVLRLCDLLEEYFAGDKEISVEEVNKIFEIK